MPDADPLLEIADDLYALPLADFTPARDALVKEHKADKALAASIKGLRKASAAAWVVNLLVRRDPDQVDQVLAVGEALREAQENLDATQLREFTKQRRQLTATVTTPRAGWRARRGSGRPSPSPSRWRRPSPPRCWSRTPRVPCAAGCW